jgi:glucose-6-phosphate 1-dehydrogenase
MAAPPTILVTFGATGDLMKKKVIPSLHYLFESGVLPERFACVGFSRRDWSDDDFRDYVHEKLVERRDAPRDDPATQEFLSMFHFAGGTFEDEGAYERLAATMAGISDEWEAACANRLYYLAVPPNFYEGIFQSLSRSGLADACSEEDGWTRVLVEKPFGKDAETAKELDDLLASLFREEQIYRIDHYLAKEMLQGIMQFRFANNLLESGWDRETIESIEIELHETLGVEDRGTFYDGVGALRDVGQNHFLQMLALITMDQPAGMQANAVRAQRARLLRTLRPLSRAEIEQDTYRAQYEGYRDIDGVEPDSDTETFFKIKLSLDHPRWKGVPVTMAGGKRVGGEPRKDITVNFRHPSSCLCEDEEHHRNRVVFALEPEESIRIDFYTKRPGFESESQLRSFDFMLYEKGEKLQYVEEYSKLLLDAIHGDQTLFVSTEEVQAMWEFVDPIAEAWSQGSVPLDTYEPDTAQPIEKSADIDVATVRVEIPRSREIGIVGLGKMGAGLARNLLDDGWRVVGINRTDAVTRELADDGLIPTFTPEELVSALRPPRIVWLMLPAGRVTDDAIFGDSEIGQAGFADLLDPGDTIVDGGNGHFRDDAPRDVRLAEMGIRYVDVGVSGGPRGAREGACLMVGGSRAAFRECERLYADLAVEGGYAHFPGAGAGHFVKMVHNGIEYGMMQAVAEGFAIMRESPFEIDLQAAADVYDHASVIESRLVNWLRRAYELHGTDLEGISGTVGHTGEGQWTAEYARELGVPVPIIRGSFDFRVGSEKEPSYTGRVLSALRNQFGGHDA